MEFTNEIYFDKNLVENQTVKISYTGKLFREFSSEVYIVYGYGPNWDNTQEHKMNLTEDCFYADINITGTDTFNFCFRNNYNIWDNNNTFNYIATIYPNDLNSINDGYSESSSASISASTTEVEENANDETENSSEETTDSSTNNFQNESGDIFSNLLESLLNDMDDSNEKNDLPLQKDANYGLENFGTIESSASESLNELFNELYAEYEKSEAYSNVQNINEADLDNLFDKVFNYEETTEENIEKAQDLSSELEELMNNILNSVLESDSINDNIVNELDAAIDNQLNEYDAAMAETQVVEAPISEDTKTYADLENAQVPAVISTSKIDLFFDASYKFLQNVGVACKKFATLIKLKAQEFGFIKEDN